MTRLTRSAGPTPAQPHRRPAPDRPGELAGLGETLGDAGVNLRGLAAFTGEGNGVIHLLVEDEDAERATNALHDAKIGIADHREVIFFDVHDRPGRWAR